MSSHYSFSITTIYQSLSTTVFNQVNTANNQMIERLYSRRLEDSNEVSMSGFPDNTLKLKSEEHGSIRGVNKDVNGNKWSIFADGSGIFGSATSANMLPRYNFQGGGILSGMTYKWNDKFLTGIFNGYFGSYSRFNAGSNLRDNSYRGGIFCSYGKSTGIYFNALAGGGYDSVLVNRNINFSTINRTARAKFNAGDLNTMFSTGYNFNLGKWVFGPTTSLQYTFFGTSKFNESGANSLNIQRASWATSSLLLNVGASSGYRMDISPSLAIIPQASLGWQYEFLQNPYTINSFLSSIPIQNTSATPQRASLYTGIGLSLQWLNSFNTSFFYNVNAANKDIISHNFLLSVGLKF